jgi:hypothetical protein
LGKRRNTCREQKFSALPGKADIDRRDRDVRFVPQNRKSAKYRFLILVEQKKERPPCGGLSESTEVYGHD